MALTIIKNTHHSILRCLNKSWESRSSNFKIKYIAKTKDKVPGSTRNNRQGYRNLIYITLFKAKTRLPFLRIEIHWTYWKHRSVCVVVAQRYVLLIVCLNGLWSDPFPLISVLFRSQRSVCRHSSWNILESALNNFALSFMNIREY